MPTKNCYHIDLIETPEGELKIIEAHGLSGTVGVTKDAGYSPSTERIDRYLDRLAGFKRDGLVLYLVSSPFRLQCNLPASVSSWYDQLPEGSAFLDWIYPFKAYLDRLDKAALKKSTIARREFVRLVRSANKKNIDFMVGGFRGHGEDSIKVRPYEKQEEISIPLNDIGLLCVFGQELLGYPIKALTKTESFPVPLMNDPRVQYAISSDVPKWMFQLLLRSGPQGPEFDSLFPREVYYGMGLCSAGKLESFRENLPQTDGFVAVKKPLCIHHGIGISYLSGRDLNQIIDDTRDLELQHPEIREVIAEGVKSDFAYTEKDEEKLSFRNHWIKDGMIKFFPLAELGSVILQEFVDAKPIKSRKTGQYHQGHIRAVILGNELIAAFYRLPETPFEKGKFVPVTGINVKTFFERTDDGLEERIAEALIPLLQSFEAQALTYSPLQLEAISNYYVLKLLGAN